VTHQSISARPGPRYRALRVVARTGLHRSIERKSRPTSDEVVDHTLLGRNTEVGGGDQRGLVSASRWVRIAIAAAGESPHMSIEGRRLVHTAGRSADPKSAQRMSFVRCGHRSPAGFPCGSAGGDGEIDGAMQHAPQPDRHAIGIVLAL
jgi:hypothetical protein